MPVRSSTMPDDSVECRVSLLPDDNPTATRLHPNPHLFSAHTLRRTFSAITLAVTLSTLILFAILSYSLFQSPASVPANYHTSGAAALIDIHRSESAGSGKPVVYVYAPTTAWVEQRSLARLLKKSNHNATYRFRERSVALLMSEREQKLPDAWLLICLLKCEVEWEQFLDEETEWTKRHLGLIHLSDENINSDYPDRGIYQKVSFVIRNYVRYNISMQIDYTLHNAKPQTRASGLDWSGLVRATRAWYSSGGTSCTDEDSTSTDSFPTDLDEAIRTYDRHFNDSTVDLRHCIEAAHPSSVRPVQALALFERGPNPAASVYWLPLGHGCDTVEDAIEQSVRPTSERPLLFGWVGDTNSDKPERAIAMDAVEAAHSRAPADGASRWLLTGGVVIKRASGFHQPVVQLLHYTQLMLDSRFVPAPAGGSPEQFRIWEAMEHAAHPIVLRQHYWAELQYLWRLGLDPVWLDDWRTLPAILLWLELTPRAIVNEWQRLRVERLRDVIDASARKLGELVVELSEVK